MSEASELSPKEQRFIEEYLVDWNATAAAKRAGYSEKTARQQASRMLSKVNIKAAIAEEQDRLSERTRITRERIMKELSRSGFADMRNFAEWSGQGVNLLDSEGLSADDSPAVKEVTARKTYQYDEDGEIVGKTVHTSLKLHDKKGSLELMGKHLGMWTDRIEQVHGGEVEIVIGGGDGGTSDTEPDTS